MPFFGSFGGGGVYKYVGPEVNGNISGGNLSMLLVTGTNNLALGSAALQDATIAENNIAIGNGALATNSLGVNNIAIGKSALEALNPTEFDLIQGPTIAIGNEAGSLLDASHGENVIAIGGGVTLSGEVFNSIIIGNASTVDTDVAGILIGHSILVNVSSSVLIGTMGRCTSTRGDLPCNQFLPITSSVTLGYDVEIGGTPDDVVIVGALGQTYGANAVIVGKGAKGNNNCIAIGREALAGSAMPDTDDNSIAIGNSTVAGANEIIIGNSLHTAATIGAFDLQTGIPLPLLFENFPAANSVPLYTRLRATNIGVNGSIWFSNGTRWVSENSSICILAPAPVTAGVLFAVGAAEALYSSVAEIKPGVLNLGDSIRFRAAFNYPTIGVANRHVYLKIAATSAGILAGNVAAAYSTTSAVNNWNNTEKVSVVSDNVNIKRQPVGVATFTVGIGALADIAIQNISSASNFVAISAAPSADTSILIYSGSVWIDFASA